MTPLLLAARDAGDIASIVTGIILLGTVGYFAVRAILRERRRDAPPVSGAQASTPPLAEEPKCPCGARATKPLPRARVRELPIVGRRLSRDVDPFAEPVVCDAHADVAASVIDERIAEANLLDARAQRDKLTALANNTADTLGLIVQTLPEDKQRAYTRSLRPMPAVRVLRAANGEEGGEGG